MNLKLASQTLTIAGHQITFDLPADPEHMLQLALAGEAAGSSDWDPYWGLLWAAAPVTAELLLRTNWTRRLKSLEVGCGVGVAGIAALMAGLDVVFADHAPDAVGMALSNAAQNGFPDATGIIFDWKQPPSEQFEFIFGSDILYDSVAHEPLLTTLAAMLSSDGIVWIGDAGRANAPLFVDKALAAGWQVEVRDKNNELVRQPQHLQFRMIVLTRPSQGQIPPVIERQSTGRVLKELTSGHGN